MNKEIAIVIPALNEAASIESVINVASEYGTVIVVNDGSSDLTAEIAINAGAVVVTHMFNLGYEAALTSGLEKATEIGCKYAVTLDADGQHNPNILIQFSDHFMRGKRLVLGVRDVHQRIGEKIFSIVGNFLWGIKDPLCGMKGYKLDLFIDHGSFDTLRAVGVEFAVKCIRQERKNVGEVQIKTRPREGESRYGGSIKANIKILLALMRMMKVYGFR